MTKLQELRDLILEANPKQGGRPFKFAPITLAQVLNAINKTASIKDKKQTIFNVIDLWSEDLNKDLDHQDDSTKEALYELLKGE